MFAKRKDTIIKRFFYKIILFNILLGIPWFMFASTAQAQSTPQVISVDCNIGESLQSTINGLPPSGGVVINFVGTCVENVLIRRDDVQLSGGGIGVVQGQVVARGDRLIFVNMTVSGSGIVADAGADVLISGVTLNGPGSGNGISVQLNAAAIIVNTSVSGYRTGVSLRESAAANFNAVTIDNSTTGVSARASSAAISNSTISNSTSFGLIAVEISAVRLTNSTIEIDVAALPGGNAAIGVFRQSVVRLLGSNTIGNTNANGRAINISQQSWLRQGNGTAIINSLGDVLTVSRQSGADLRAFQVGGNIVGSDKSYLELRNGTLTGNITLFRDSEIMFSDTDGIVTVSGDFMCEDFESSHTLAAGTVISGITDCSRFK
jgi:hypothetical protein